MNILRNILALSLLTFVSFTSTSMAQAVRSVKPTADSLAIASQRHDLKVGRAMETFFNIFREVNLYYVDTISPSNMIKVAGDAMLDELDPYTVYLPKEKMDEFETMTTGRYAGMGALIRSSSEGDWIEVAEPYRDTPSDKAGLKAGDRIISVDGVSLKGLKVADASNLLRGKAGVVAQLVIRPIADTTTTRMVAVKRERIKVPAVPYYGWVKSGLGDRVDSVGYIRLNNFTDNCAAEVRKALTTLRSQTLEKTPLKGLILDLRGNTGGILSEAVKIVGLFTPRNTTVVTMRGRVSQMNKNFRTVGEPVAPNVPLVVLINGRSASASEIVAGALQDMDRAVVVGKRSFGKGLVQSTRPVGEDGYVKLTSAKYYIPSGRCIQALDYNNQNEDGSVGSIPDSLIGEFRTAAGRMVYDGGGIMPDVRIAAEYYAKFTAILMGMGYVDDFANRYAIEHSAVAVNGGFAIDDSTYAEFSRFIEAQNIGFVSETERHLERLRKVAEGEKYAGRIVAELEAIAEKIKDDKTVELESCEAELRNVLADAIVARWYYDAGRIEYMLLRDKKTLKAAEILLDRSKYTQIVTMQNTDKK